MQQGTLRTIIPHRLALGTIDPRRHAARLYLAELAPITAANSRRMLTFMARMLTGGVCNWQTLAWHRLEYADLAELVQSLRVGRQLTTVRAHLAAVRGVLRVAWRLGLLDGDAYLRLASVRLPRSPRLPAGRALSGAELAALFSVLDTSSLTDLRAGALIAVMSGAGLRSIGARRLRLESWADGERLGRLKVCGKGNRERYAYLGGEARLWLRRWLAARGPQPGFVFCAFLSVARGNSSDRILLLQPAHPIDAAAVFRAVQSVARRAGIRCTPHDLRRTYATELYRRGAKLMDVSALLGHANIATTSSYLRTDEDQKQAAALLLDNSLC